MARTLSEAAVRKYFSQNFAPLLSAPGYYDRDAVAYEVRKAREKMTRLAQLDRMLAPMLIERRELVKRLKAHHKRALATFHNDDPMRSP